MRRRSTLEDTELVERLTEPISQPDRMNKSKTVLPSLPRRGHRLWRTDYVATACCLLCFATAICTVFQPVVAAWLGQVNQLISLSNSVDAPFCAEADLARPFEGWIHSQRAAPVVDLDDDEQMAQFVWK